VHRRAGALDDGLYYRLVIAAGASPPGPGSVVARAWPVGFCACSAWRAGGWRSWLWDPRAAASRIAACRRIRRPDPLLHGLL